jgi:hypothetical protein
MIRQIENFLVSDSSVPTTSKTIANSLWSNEDSACPTTPGSPQASLPFTLAGRMFLECGNFAAGLKTLCSLPRHVSGNVIVWSNSRIAMDLESRLRLTSLCIPKVCRRVQRLDRVSWHMRIIWYRLLCKADLTSTTLTLEAHRCSETDSYTLYWRKGHLRRQNHMGLTSELRRPRKLLVIMRVIQGVFVSMRRKASRNMARRLGLPWLSLLLLRLEEFGNACF